MSEPSERSMERAREVLAAHLAATGVVVNPLYREPLARILAAALDEAHEEGRREGAERAAQIVERSANFGDAAAAIRARSNPSEPAEVTGRTTADNTARVIGQTSEPAEGGS